MVADAAGVAASVVAKIRSGQRKKIRAKTAKRILEVDDGAVSDVAHIDAKETHQLLREMLRHGYTKTEIAARLGSKAKVPALQLKAKKVTAKNAHKVRKLHKEVMEEVAQGKLDKYFCTKCGRSHAKKYRHAFLKRNLPRTSKQLKDLWSCAYGGIAGDRALYRDLNELHAEADCGVWRPPARLKQ
jgi:hypothetical protein